MPKITELFAFVAEEGPDDEGVMGMLVPPPFGQKGPHQWMPLLGADMDRIHALLPFAKQISAETGVKYKLLHFKLSGEIEDLTKP